MASTLRRLTVWFQARIGGFQRDVGRARGSMRMFGRSAAGVATSITRLRNLLLSGIGLIFLARGIRSVVEEWGKFEKSVAKVNTFLKSTGGTVGLTRKNILDFSKELQNLTGILDTDTLDSMALLGSFVKITGLEFERATRATADLAAFMGVDMSRAAIQLGKALSDPFRGLTALRRVGVVFTDMEVRQIKFFHSIGDTAAAMNLTLQALETQGIKGAAAQFLKTSAGALQKLTSEWAVFKREIGEQVTPVVVVLGEEIVGLVDDGTGAGKALVGAFKSVALGVAHVVDGVKLLSIGLRGIFVLALDGMRKLIEGIEWLDRITPGRLLPQGMKGIAGLDRGGKFGKARPGEDLGGPVKISDKMLAFRNEMAAGLKDDIGEFLVGKTAVEDVNRFFTKVEQRANDFKKAMNQPLPTPTWWELQIQRHATIWKTLQEKYASEAAKMVVATRTPLEKYEQALDKANRARLLDIISWETYGRVIRMAREELDKTFKSQKKIKPLQLAGAVEVGASRVGHADAFRASNPVVGIGKQQLVVQKEIRDGIKRVEKKLLPAPVGTI